MKKNTIIIGDTRDFHIGSFINFTELCNLISEEFNILGIYGDNTFEYSDYSDFLQNISTQKNLINKIKKCDVVFIHGEGMMEHNSKWGHSLFYIAKYIRENYPGTETRLVNFSCDVKDFDEWTNFDKIVPRDSSTQSLLQEYLETKIGLGFDCSILKEYKKIESSIKHDFTIFRGRKGIESHDIKLIQDEFPNARITKNSSFWAFESIENAAKNFDDLYRIYRESKIIISSSFHGIVFSLLFEKPFIPVDTLNTHKNASVAKDILGPYYKKRTIDKWVRFYKRPNNLESVIDHIKKTKIVLKKKARSYIETNINAPSNL